MYAAPAVTPVRTAGAQRNAFLYSLAGITCIVVSLFLIAATIVVALIPIYMANRSTTVDQAKSLSKEVTVTVPLNSITSASRRRRQTTDNSTDSAIGAEAGPEFRNQIASLMKAKMDSSVVKDVLVTSITLGEEDSSTGRKRWALKKRSSKRKTFIIKLKIKYQFGLSESRQSAASDGIKVGITQTFTDNPNFSNIPLYRGGSLVFTIGSVQCAPPTNIPDIIPGTSSSTVATASTTVATTTVAATSSRATTASTTVAVTPILPG